MNNEHTENPIPENLDDSIELLNRAVTLGESTALDGMTDAEKTAHLKTIADCKAQLKEFQALRLQVEPDSQNN